MIKVKHLKTGRVYELLSKGKMKVNGEWLESYIYKGKDKTTGEYTYFTRMKEDFENHFIFMNCGGAGEVWHEGLTCQPIVERSAYDPVVYSIDGKLYVDKYNLGIPTPIRVRSFMWAYSSDLINYNFKHMEE